MLCCSSGVRRATPFAGVPVKGDWARVVRSKGPIQSEAARTCHSLGAGLAPPSSGRFAPLWQGGRSICPAKTGTDTILLCSGLQTHENREHLVMMEKILGPIPSHMIHRTR